VLAGAAALAVTVYTGFVLNTVKAVPFWNSTLLPVLFVLCGVLGGFGLSVVIALSGGSINLDIAEAGSRWLLIINALLIAVYLWAAANRAPTGKQSVLEQMRGGLALFFWGGIVVLGIVLPLLIGFFGQFAGNGASALLITGVACEIIGGLALRYCVLKAGAYKPLVARSA